MGLRKGVRWRNGAKGWVCVVTLLGDEANMHALDLAKVHLDRIALHYAVLQRCSISYGATNRWRRVETGERGRNGISGDLVRSLSPSCVPLSHRPGILWPLRSPDVTKPVRRCPVSRTAKGQRMLNNLRGTSGLELYRELYHICPCILARVDTHELGQYRVHARVCVYVCMYVGGNCQGNSILHAWIIACRLSRAYAPDIVELYFSGVFLARERGGEAAAGTRWVGWLV